MFTGYNPDIISHSIACIFLFSNIDIIALLVVKYPPLGLVIWTGLTLLLFLSNNGIYTSSVGIKFINPASEHISTGITQGSTGKRQAAAVVKIMFNGNRRGNGAYDEGILWRHHLIPMSGSNAADVFVKSSPARVRREPASYHI